MVESPTGKMKWLRNPIDNRYVATITVAIGIAHFLAPSRFEPINVKLGFAHAPRRYVYINGAIEAAIGLTSFSRRTRPLNRLLSVVYPFHLARAYLYQTAQQASRPEQGGRELGQPAH